MITLWYGLYYLVVSLMNVMYGKKWSSSIIVEMYKYRNMSIMDCLYVC